MGIGNVPSKDGCYWLCVQTFIFVTRAMAVAYRKNTENVSVEGEREGSFQTLVWDVVATVVFP